MIKEPTMASTTDLVPQVRKGETFPSITAEPNPKNIEKRYNKNRVNFIALNIFIPNLLLETGRLSM